MVVVKKRLQTQPKGRRGLDKSINFVTDDTPEGDRVRLRGIIFPVESVEDVDHVHGKLLKMARRAAREGSLDDFVRSLEGKVTNPAQALLLRDLSTEWERTVLNGSGLRESGVETDRGILWNHIVAYFGHLRLDEIAPRDIDRYRALKSKQKHRSGAGYCSSAINNHLSVLNRLLKKAVEYGYVEKSVVVPGAWMRPDKTVEESSNWWTPTEQAQVLSVLESWRQSDPLMRLAILIQLVTGIRFCEL